MYSLGEFSSQEAWKKSLKTLRERALLKHLGGGSVAM